MVWVTRSFGGNRPSVEDAPAAVSGSGLVAGLGTCVPQNIVERCGVDRATAGPDGGREQLHRMESAGPYLDRFLVG